MAKVTRKTQTPPASNAVTPQPTSSTKGRKHAKTSCQPRSRDSGKVTKTTMRVKKHPRRNLTKKASPKTSTPSRKDKSRESKHFGHYRRLNQVLNQNEPGCDQETVEKPTTSRAYPGSQ
ncbi:spermatid nuclear transition protein 4-like [Neomonachus schauinslandi]|uniref:Spermatid nuclear transition protein 4-like n=1 Tax=Neomonachus schauinslandi TaxID=29088 RepID=A0A2Y9GJL4_NEOSC|nr:spermatid nuclear transition protein 4-like [Neomonachus schauinslandi]